MYVSGGSQLLAIRPTNGSTIWSLSFHGVTLTAPTLDAAGTLYIASSDCRVYGVQTRTGQPVVLWGFDTSTLEPFAVGTTNEAQARTRQGGAGMAGTSHAEASNGYELGTAWSKGAKNASCLMSPVIIGFDNVVFVYSNHAGVTAIADNKACTMWTNGTAPLSWSALCGCIVVLLSGNNISAVAPMNVSACGTQRVLFSQLRDVDLSNNLLSELLAGAFAGASAPPAA